MGLKMITNPNMLEVRLAQIGERAVKGMSDRMRRHAVRIRDLARAYAPVKTGLLENSIDYVTQRDNNRRNTYIVFIDLDATKPIGSKSRRLGEYAFVMEERLTPAGPLKLGTLSMAKKLVTGRKVGGRFLSRAIGEATREVLQDMAREVRRHTSSGISSVGVNYVRDIGDDE